MAQESLSHRTPSVGVIIATALSRTDLLFSRSLPSVLKQSHQADTILIVDDNEDPEEADRIQATLAQMRTPNVRYMRNAGAHAMSGTGAWNTGLQALSQMLEPRDYVAILDDDDSWDRDYLKHCIAESASFPSAIFAFLKRSDCDAPSRFTQEDLTTDSFLMGNKGVQGSNMIFRLDAILGIGGFDETLCSCTDRDLMIRFLERHGKEDIRIVPEVLVHHHSHPGAITNNADIKRRGIDAFMDKHFHRFKSFDTLSLSLRRAERLFAYPHAQRWLNRFKRARSILVTGVCGLIGSHAARCLTMSGWSVLGVDDLSTGSMGNIAQLLRDPKREGVDFTFIRADVADTAAMADIFSKYPIWCIIHLAALPRVLFCHRHPAESLRANVHATVALANEAKRHGVERFIFSSSSSVYGGGDGTPMVETQPPKPMSDYARQKLRAEEELTKIFAEGPTSLIICRFFNVYGYSRQPTDSYSTLILKWLTMADEARANEEKGEQRHLPLHGDGSHRRDFTHAQDVALALERCASVHLPSRREIINIGTGTTTSVTEVANLMGVTALLCPEPLPVAEPEQTMAHTGKANEILGWEPTIGLREGIEMTRTAMREDRALVIGVALHNGADTIGRCLSSIASQVGVKRRVITIIADDASTDHWLRRVEHILASMEHDIIHLNNLNVAKTRNDMNSYIRRHYPNADLIGRLDADDELADAHVLASIEHELDASHPDAILCGNLLRSESGRELARRSPSDEDAKRTKLTNLRSHGNILERVNRATPQLLDRDYLLSRLRAMAAGDATAELPSCNLWMKPDAVVLYPSLPSAEDHALLVHYLLRANHYKISMMEKTFMTIYSLSGIATATNKMGGDYINSRKTILRMAENHE